MNLISMPRAAWRRQPQGAVEVDWNHGIAKSLKLASLPSLAYRTLSSVTTVPSLITARDEVVVSMGGTTPVPNLSPINGVTVLGRLGALSSVDDGRIIQCGDSGLGGWRIEKSYVSITLTFYGIANYSGVQIAFDSSAWLPNTISFACVFDNANSTTYLNGRSIFSESVSSSIASTEPLKIEVMKHSVLFVFNRRLNDFEIFELHRNPWQLFRSCPARFILIPSFGGVISLIVQNASHVHSVESLTLTQAHVLALADSLHSHSAESPLLSQAYALTLAAAAHSHVVESPSLTQAHSLAANGATHAHSAESLTMIQAHVLTLANTAHSHSADNLTLTVAGSLVVADSDHVHTVDSPGLTQAHVLTLQAVDHAHMADNLTLTQGYVLAPADALHSQASEAVTLSTGLNLNLADSLHSHGAEAPSLIQANALTLADAWHGQSVETLNLGQGFSLVMADAAHSHSTESPTLSVAFVLSILDAVHAQYADALALATHVTLIVSDTLHAHYAGAAVESSITPAGRVFLVRGEDRVFLIISEDRTFGVT